MLARIAHELFWLGRSVARAEHTARMLDGVLQATLQGRPDDPAGVRLGWRSLPAIMGASSSDGGDRAAHPRRGPALAHARPGQPRLRRGVRGACP